MKCNHRFVSGPLYRGVPGASLGECDEETLPHMVCCTEHAHKESLVLLIKHLDKELARVERELAKLRDTK